VAEQFSKERSLKSFCCSRACSWLLFGLDISTEQRFFFLTNPTELTFLKNTNNLPYPAILAIQERMPGPGYSDLWDLIASTGSGELAEGSE
jgi:hypothetical protein